MTMMSLFEQVVSYSLAITHNSFDSSNLFYHLDHYYYFQIKMIWVWLKVIYIFFMHLGIWFEISSFLLIYYQQVQQNQGGVYLKTSLHLKCFLLFYIFRSLSFTQVKFEFIIIVIVFVFKWLYFIDML